jgi:hypothetical protein
MCSYTYKNRTIKPFPIVLNRVGREPRGRDGKGNLTSVHVSLFRIVTMNASYVTNIS